MSNIDELKLLQKQSLAAAKLSGEKHYRGYVPCKHGHVSDRLVSTQQCCKCLELRKRGMRKVDGVPQSKSSRVKKNTALNPGKHTISQAWHASVAISPRGLCRRDNVLNAYPCGIAKMSRRY